MGMKSGGELVAEFLLKQNISQLFTLCGGHISPILVASKALGILVIDTRHEADAVFAADATARLTGKVGVVAVTAGPGITNSVTALQNAMLAQSPVVLLGGAAPTLLKGRGALQDIDQVRLMLPNVKWAGAIRKRKEIIHQLTKAFLKAKEGTPGPVFLELPVDLLYPENLVKSWYDQAKTKGKTIPQKVTNWYINRHVKGIYSGTIPPIKTINQTKSESGSFNVTKLQQLVARSQKPVLLIGSGAITQPENITDLAEAVATLGIPTYLSGMARGLLGANHPLHFRHRRKAALKSADLVILCGVVCDFRLDYGNHLGRATYVSINRDRTDLYKNRKPDLAIHSDPHPVICEWSGTLPKSPDWSAWKAELRENEEAREQEIQAQAHVTSKHGINPLQLFRQLDKELTEHAIIVADGGDFVGTASYTLAPRKQLSWLDPGSFGTLGVGGGFALGAKTVNPDAEVFIIYGDGSSAYSLMEMDAFMRHRMPVIAIIGNDASWNQIARDQVEMLKDDCGTALAHSDYEHVAKAFGATGSRVETMQEFVDALKAARKANANGQSYVINAILAPSDFRKGSLSM